MRACSIRELNYTNLVGTDDHSILLLESIESTNDFSLLIESIESTNDFSLLIHLIKEPFMPLR